MKKSIKSLLKKRVVILDGATATQLIQAGMPPGLSPELWALDNPSIVKAIHADYLRAGSDVVYACTFGANRSKLAKYKASAVGQINKDLARLARAAARGKGLVAGDIGPTGNFIEPFGPLAFEEAVNIFKEQVGGLLEGGVDLFVIETMMDIQEARAALLAVKELTNKFTIVTMTYEKEGRTLNGTDPVTALITLQSLGADAVGCNCSTGPRQMLSFIEMMKPYALVPLVAKPNAGLPKLVDGQTVFEMKPKEFAGRARDFAAKGANMLGGCCGTTPRHIKELKKKLKKVRPRAPLSRSLRALSSARKSVVLSPDGPLLVVGECINPTGKQDLTKELVAGKTSLVRQLAKQQEAGGAELLDVNVGAAGVDEKATLAAAVKMLALSCDLPLVIDSAKIEAVEAALRLYPGRVLINSISGQRPKLKGLLPLAAKYGAMFILLPLGGKRLPHSFGERKRNIKRILKKAKQLRFTADDIVVDGLALSLSSNPDSLAACLQTLTWARNSLGCNTILGLSNISFGIPQRTCINSTFLACARASGLSLAIANPLNKELMNTKHALDLLMNKDKDAALYLARFGSRALRAPATLSGQPRKRLELAVMEGDRDQIKGIIQQALQAGESADKLMREVMIPAINKVGDLFDKRQYFLPQLIASAEAMKIGFKFLEPRLKKAAAGSAKKTVIILATVKGDIHDIGKNIVALMLKNHGFSVIDLGSDVACDKIIREIKQHPSPVVGLSALMTTTMVNMEEVIRAVAKEGLDCRFIVGGAVVTKSYAHSLGAEYAADGVEAVRAVKKLNR